MSILPLVACSLLVTAQAGDPTARPDASVIRVVARIRLPNPLRPWTSQAPVEVSGTGIVIEGGKILTNAHLVNYATEVEVQGADGGDRIPARVASIGPGIDLALLVPEDESFLTDHPAIVRAKALPEVGATVQFYGFPVGGNALAVGRGAVSRIEYGLFNPYTGGLRIQVDAAVNPGNSGGPALVAGEMIGVVFGQFDQAQNVGYLVPNEEIDGFLADVADGKYDGKPWLEDQFQPLKNPALRSRLGLDRAARGVMVREPARRDDSYPLREFDVITRAGDRPIDNEGMLEARPGLRGVLPYLVPVLAHDQTLALTVLREGQTLEVSVPVRNQDDRLIRTLDGGTIPYFIHGPLVFAPLMADALPVYLQVNPGLVGRAGPRLRRGRDRVAFPGEQLVVVTSPLLPHPIARGYEEPLGQVIETINGTKIRNLGHLVEVIRDCQDEYLTIRFAEEYAETLVFRRGDMESATAQVMTENGIPRRGSADVLAIWEKQGPDQKP
jgi:S1-C subfamily serine protease